MFVFPVGPLFRLRVSHHLDHAPFPHPAHQTGRAVFPHPAFGQGLLNGNSHTFAHEPLPLRSLESTSVRSLRRARIFWTSVRHLGRLTDVARAPVSGRTCELRLNDIHGKNAEISPDFQMVSRSGQALGPHPYQPLK